MNIYSDSISKVMHLVSALRNDDNPILKSSGSKPGKDDLLSNLTALTRTTSTPVPTAKDYYCEICAQTMKLTSIEILRHRATHQN